jgi:Ni/Co efflux regulator RcnB
MAIHGRQATAAAQLSARPAVQGQFTREDRCCGVAQFWSKTGEMKRLTRIVAAAVLAAALGAGGPAAADPHGKGHGNGWGHAQRAWRGDRDGPPRGGPVRAGPPRGGGRWSYGPPPEAYAPSPPRAYGGYRGEPPYALREPPGYAVRRGGRIPPEYRGAVVPDYGRHRLRPPPPGYAWVRMGDRYMLVSRGTGQIFDVIEP